jgi:superkiller protein 3
MSLSVILPLGKMVYRIALVKRMTTCSLLSSSLMVYLPSQLMAQASPAGIEALIQQANEARQSGDCPQAETKWRAVVASLPEDNPQLPPSYFQLGLALSCQGKAVEAITFYQRAIQVGDESGQAAPAIAYRVLGGALYNFAQQNTADSEKLAGLLQEAVDAYSQSIQAESNDPDNDYLALVGAGNALDDLGHTLNDPSRIDLALQAYKQAVQINPNAPNAWLELGFALKRQNRLDEAIEAYEMARQAEPTNRRAVNALVEIYQQVLRRDSRNVLAYLNLGNLFLVQDRYVDALGAFDQAANLASDGSSDKANAYNGRGRVFSRQNRYDDAIQEYRKALEVIPNYAFAYNNIAVALVQQGNPNGAIEAYQDALAQPDQQGDPASAHTLAHNGLGLIYLEQGNLDQAADEFEAAVTITPNFEVARSNLSEVRNRQELSQCSESLPSERDEPLVNVLRSVVAVNAKVSEGIGSGTGWVIKREGNRAWVVTNRHVVTDRQTQQLSEQIAVSFYGRGQTGQNQPCGVVNARIFQVSTDPILDLAVLEIDNLPEDIQPLKLATTPVPLETAIRIIGHPASANGGRTFYWSSLTGTINGVSDTEMQLTASLGGGASGAPILNQRNNQVLGMVFGGNQLDRGNYLGQAFPISYLEKQFRAWGLL